MMRWWGWGEDGHDPELTPAAEAMLGDELGADLSVRREHASLEGVELAAPRLSPAAHAALAATAGPEALRIDTETRVNHAAGRGYADLVRLRAGDFSGAPDAVLVPASADQLPAVLAACAEHGVAVVPFGGGTSVVGGVEPLKGGHDAVITLDLSRLDSIADVDKVSLTATFGAGLFGPRAEDELGAQGLTLGHFPQSFEFSTVGGWVATRSAGQASTGYGRIDELVEGLRLCAPAGELVLGPIPATAAGPSLLELAVGSEGALGVITEATLRVRPAPQERIYEGWSFGSFAAGCEAFRALEQRHASPDVARLSDEEETRLSMAQAGEGRAQRLGRAYLKARGHEGGCIAIVGYEGSADDVSERQKRTSALLRAGGGVALGGRPGRTWEHGRFAGPYLRDVLMDRGVMVETLETAGSWTAPGRSARCGGRGAPRIAHRSRHAAAGDVPRLAPVSVGRIALLHVPRPPGRGRGARAVERGQERGQRGDRQLGRHHHAPSRGRARPPALDARRGGRRGHRPAEGGEARAGPHGDHEPREAGVAARLGLLLGQLLLLLLSAARDLRLGTALQGREGTAQDRLAGVLGVAVDRLA